MLPLNTLLVLSNTSSFADLVVRSRHLWSGSTHRPWCAGPWLKRQAFLSLFPSGGEKCTRCLRGNWQYGPCTYEIQNYGVATTGQISTLVFINTVWQAKREKYRLLLSLNRCFKEREHLPPLLAVSSSTVVSFTGSFLPGNPSSVSALLYVLQNASLPKCSVCRVYCLSSLSPTEGTFSLLTYICGSRSVGGIQDIHAYLEVGEMVYTANIIENWSWISGTCVRQLTIACNSSQCQPSGLHALVPTRTHTPYDILKPLEAHEQSGLGRASVFFFF